MIKTYENFNLTKIHKYFNPKNILFKLRKFGLECNYRVSEFDKYKTIFYSTSPIPKELQEEELNEVGLRRNGNLVYRIYTTWYPCRIFLEIVDQEKEIIQRQELKDVDPWYEEKWENSEDENQIIPVNSYEEAFNKILELENEKND